MPRRNRQKELISREITGASDVLRGQIVSPVTFKLFDPSGAKDLTPVADVDVGSNRIVRNVIVRQAGARGRAFAQIGLAVEIRRGQRGRWVVVGPSDRVPKFGTVVELDEDTGGTTALPNDGVDVVKQAYDYYRGDLPGTPGSGLYGTPGYPKYLQVDALGNEVTS